MQNAAYWKQIIYRPGPVLDPISRLSEIVFGLIMVLTFTCSISAASSGREEIGVVLWAALGCNVAWGIVDACMYIMSLMMERGDASKALRTVQQSTNKEDAAEALKDYLPPVLTSVIKDEQMQAMCQQLKSVPVAPTSIPIFWRDIKAAIVIFILVTLSTLPCTIPFLIIKDPMVAMRASNIVALALLFFTGYKLGVYSGYNKWLLGFIVAALGVALVLLTIALGG
jgi:hypothetical protein